MNKSPSYVPSLDGLRALSIAAVLLFHLQIPYLSLGWGGVNLFFVLSGFLITGILLDSKQDRHYFKNFYARRVLRIFPIYYLTVFGTIGLLLVAGKFGLGSTNLTSTELFRTLPYYLTYLQNFFLANNRYATPLPQLSHTWSLAVEEQFYFIWPLVVYQLSAKRTMIFSMVLVALAPIIRLCVAATTNNVYLQYSLIFTQMDQLAFGALLAGLVRSNVLSQRQMSQGAKWIIALSGLFSVAYILNFGFKVRQSIWNPASADINGFRVIFEAFSMGLNGFWFPEDFLNNPFGHTIYTILGLFCAGIIAFVILDPSSTLSRFLETKALVHIGKISYGLYLFHAPIYRYVESFARHFLPNNEGLIMSLPIAILKVVLAYGVAVVSWNVIEKRFLSFKRFFLSQDHETNLHLKDSKLPEDRPEADTSKVEGDANTFMSTEMSLLRNRIVNDRPRVLVVGPGQRQVGGVTTFIQILMSSHLVAQKYQLIHLDTTRAPEDAASANKLSLRNLSYLLSQIWQLMLVVTHDQPQLMHLAITSGWSFWKGATFILIGRACRMKVVAHLHGGGFRQYYSKCPRFIRHMTGCVLKQANVVIALSGQWQGFLLKEVRSDLCVRVLPNTVDMNFAAALQQQAHGSQSTNNVVLFLGQLVQAKGIYDILRAAPLVLSRCQDARFVLAGGAPDPRILKDMQNYCVKAGLGKAVQFLGEVTGHAKLELFQQSTLFVLPSYGEGLPYALLEAMATGLPVITTPVGAIPEIIEEKRHGFLIQPGDYMALAQRILQILKDESLRERMGLANRRLIQELYLPDRAMSQLVRIYDSLQYAGGTRPLRPAQEKNQE